MRPPPSGMPSRASHITDDKPGQEHGYNEGAMERPIEKYECEIAGIVNDVRLAILEDMAPLTPDEEELDTKAVEEIREEIIKQVRELKLD